MVNSLVLQISLKMLMIFILKEQALILMGPYIKFTVTLFLQVTVETVEWRRKIAKVKTIKTSQIL